MPEQLIFTSKPTGIQPGRSGFQVVAQHNDINQRLVAALEKESIYEFADSSRSLPVICKYQQFEIGDEVSYVLSRIQSCGFDFTGRPNHIAHHLIFSEKDRPACPPSAVFALWKGWRSKWENKPRYLGTWDRVNYENEAEPFYYTQFALPAKTWKAVTGDEGNAAIPMISDQKSTVFAFDEGKEDSLIWLFFESQSLVDPEEAWEYTFTNCRIDHDNLNRFLWVGQSSEFKDSALSADADLVDLTSDAHAITSPIHALADKARKTLVAPKRPFSSKPSSSVSIAPLEEDAVIQDELELEKLEEVPTTGKKKIEHDDLLEGTLTSSLPDQHTIDSFDDIFKSDDDGKPVELPDFDIHDESSVVIPKKSLYRRFRIAIWIVLILTAIGVGIMLSPDIIDLFNRKSDPTPHLSTGPTDEEIQLQERLATAELDPDARFESQLGETEQIINDGELVLARAYLRKYRSDPEKSRSEGYKQLEAWLGQQKSILELVNRKLSALNKEVQSRRVLPEFEETKRSLNQQINLLSASLQASLRQNFGTIVDEYESWIERVRLKTDSIPTFFIPISRDNPNPEVTFSEIPEVARRWFSGLESFPNTSQLEHIKIQVSVFQGLNSFELSSDDAIHLTLWKQNERSFISYFDGKTEVIEVISDPKDLSKLSFRWLFKGDSENESSVRFPEPPIIINFLNTLTNQSINVIMTGGISQAHVIPAEIPVSFLELNSDVFKVEINDPVVREKLKHFVVSPDRFLRLRSLDSRFYFAHDAETNAFHLYESNDLNSQRVRDIQSKITHLHYDLSQLEREQTIYNSVEFIKETPLWSLGKEVLPSGKCPTELENFGQFWEDKQLSYVDYLRSIVTHFADNYTHILPGVMDRWIAYPKNEIPSSNESIVIYRDMLIRSAKRLNTLLKKEDAQSLEYWRNFVANLEFWLHGEHESKLLDILSLGSSEIATANSTDIDAVIAEIDNLRTTIKGSQDELQANNNLSDLIQINQWVLEIAGMDEDSQSTPLILFK